MRAACSAGVRPSCGLLNIVIARLARPGTETPPASCLPKFRIVLLTPPVARPAAGAAAPIVGTAVVPKPPITPTGAAPVAPTVPAAAGAPAPNNPPAVPPVPPKRPPKPPAPAKPPRPPPAAPSSAPRPPPVSAPAPAPRPAPTSALPMAPRPATTGRAAAITGATNGMATAAATPRTVLTPLLISISSERHAHKSTRLIESKLGHVEVSQSRLRVSIKKLYIVCT